MHAFAQSADTEPPVISGIYNNSVSTHTFRDSYSAPDVTCTDNVDGNIPSGAIDIDQTGPPGQPASINENSLPGTYQTTYTCTDTAGNIATMITTVHITFVEIRLAATLPGTDIPLVDTEPPRFTPEVIQNVRVGLYETYVDEPPTCTDDVAGDLYVHSTGAMVVDTTMVNKHKITYTCTDPSGNKAEVSRFVIVQDATAPNDATPPVLTLKGKYTEDDPYQLRYGTTYVEPGFACKDADDPDPVVTVSDTDGVGVDIFGIVYQCYDWNDRVHSLTRYINVTHVPPPVITTLGPQSITMPQQDNGQYFTPPEYGVQCMDRAFDRIFYPTTDSVTSIDLSSTGDHTITYDCTDFGDRTTSATQTIRVRSAVQNGDNTLPQIRLSSSVPSAITDRDTVTITARVSDASGIGNIVWYDGSEIIHTDTVNNSTNQTITRTYTATFEPGAHFITAIVYDGSQQRNVGIYPGIITFDVVKFDESLLLPHVYITPDSSKVTEGTAASATITVSPSDTPDMDVQVRVQGHGEFVADGETGVKTLTVSGGSYTHVIDTTPDKTDEPDGAVSITILDGSDGCSTCGEYAVSASLRSADIIIEDDDDPFEPEINITTTAQSPVTINATHSSIPFTVEFGENVMGFESSDIQTSSGVVDNFSRAFGYRDQIGRGSTDGETVAFAQDYYIFRSPASVAINGSDYVYVVDSSRHQVIVYAPDGTYAGNNPNPFDQNNAYVADPAGRVGNQYPNLGDDSPGDGDEDVKFNTPTDIAISPTTGLIYVADTGNKRVMIFHPNHTYATQITGFLPLLQTRTNTMDIAINATGFIYITDHDRGKNPHTVKVFYPNHTLADTIGGTKGDNPGQLNWPGEVAINSTGHIFISGGIDVRVFNPDHTYAYTFGDGSTTGTDGRTAALGDLSGINSIYIDNMDRIYIVEANNHRVSVFAPDGTFLYAFGSDGDGDGQFRNPQGVAINSKGHIYVADEAGSGVKSQTAYRVSIFGPSPNYSFDVSNPASGQLVVSIPPGAVQHIETQNSNINAGVARIEVNSNNVLPDRPTNLQAAAGDGQVLLTWNAPANNGSHPITDYFIQHNPAGPQDWTGYDDGMRTVTGAIVMGLDNGIEHAFRVRATTDAGNSTWSGITTATPKAIPPTNNPPDLTLTGPPTVTLTVDDPYNDRGATCNDDEDGTINPTISSNTVDTSSPGTYHVVWRCEDSGNKFDTETRTIIVNARPAPPPTNNPPDLTLTGPPTVTLTVDDPYNDRGATCNDDEDGTINPTISSNTVDTSSPGTYHVVWRCEDSGNKFDTETRTIIVNARPAPPPINNPPDLTLTGPPTVTLTVDDPYNDRGATCNDDEDGTINPTISSNTVDTSSPGTYHVVWRCEDSGNKFDTETRTVIVQRNGNGGNTDTTRPVFTSTDTLTFTELESSTRAVVATDSSAVTYALASHNVTGTPLPTVSTAGQLAWTPSEAQGSGNPNTIYRVTINATDSHGNSAQQVIHITVSELNDPPALTLIQAQNTVSGQSITIALEATDPDVPANTLTYTHNQTFGTITKTDSRTAIFAWTPTTSDVGTHYVEFTVSDGMMGDTDSQVVTFMISDVTISDNDPPEFTSIDTVEFAELVPSTHTVAVNDSSAVVFDLASHNVTGTPAPTVSATTGLLEWTPSEVHGGNPNTIYHVTINATDSHGNSASQGIHITVSESNTRPVLTSIQAQQNHISGQPITIALEATDSDVPANTLTYDHNHTSGTITKTDSRTASFAWTPGTSDVGTHYVEFTVSDGMGGTYSQVVTFVISNTMNQGTTDMQSSAPDAPTNLMIVAVGGGYATLSWSVPSNDGGSPITDYIVQYSSDAGSSWHTFNGTVSSMSANVTGLVNGLSYQFRVSAVNSEGSSDHSNIPAPVRLVDTGDGTGGGTGGNTDPPVDTDGGTGGNTDPPVDTDGGTGGNTDPPVDTDGGTGGTADLPSDNNNEPPAPKICR